MPLTERQTIVREMAPAYRTIAFKLARSRLYPELKRVVELSRQKGKLDPYQVRAVKEMLRGVGRFIFESVEDQVAALNQEPASKRVRHFKEIFGHPPFGFRGAGHLGSPLDAHCVANAFAVTYLLEKFGGHRVFALRMPNHVVPGIQIRDTHFVLDQNDYAQRGAYTYYEYLETLLQARFNPHDPLHPLIKNFPPAAFDSVHDLHSRMHLLYGSRPALAGAYANLAQAYRQEARPHEALAHWKKAEELSPDFSWVSSQLGLLHERMGNRPAALEAYRRALQRFPIDPLVQRRMKKLAGNYPEWEKYWNLPRRKTRR